MCNLFQSRLTLLMAFSAASVLMGCGAGGGAGGARTEVYSVTGTLQINGQPATDAWVTLAPDFEGVPTPVARVGADGTFKMSVYDDEVRNFQPPGDPVGDYFVLVRMPRDPASLLSGDRLEGAYSDPKVFKHLVSIQLGENKLEPISIDNAKLAN